MIHLDDLYMNFRDAKDTILDQLLDYEDELDDANDSDKIVIFNTIEQIKRQLENVDETLLQLVNFYV